jgi:hypothetical protein
MWGAVYLMMIVGKSLKANAALTYTDSADVD